MKILLVGTYFPDSIVFHIEKALRNLGHDVELFGIRNEVASTDIINRLKVKIKYHSPKTSPIFTHFINKALLKKAIKYSPDLIFMMKGAIITSHTIKELKRTCSATIVNWFPDDPFLYFKEDTLKTVSSYDYFFMTDSSFEKKLSEEGLSNIGFIPYATDPDINRTVELSEDDIKKYSCDVCMVGSYYPYRLRFLRELTDFDLAIWGQFWHRLDKDSIFRKFWRGRPVWLEEKVKVYNASKIVLDTHHPQNINGGTNSRVFDALSCGAFVLTEKADDYRKLLKIGDEIVTFDGIDDLVDKVRYYLDQPQERDDIARRGQLRTQSEHTFIHRMEKILSIIS